MHPRFRRSCVGGQLQRYRASHQRIGKINRDIGDALERRGCRVRSLDRDVRCVVETTLDRLLEYGVADGFRCIDVEFRQAQERAQHTQHFPRRPRFAARVHDRVKRLCPPFAIDECARGFRKRGDWQHHVGVCRTMLEGAHDDDKLRFFERGACRDGIGAIEFGFDMQQQIGASRIDEHRLRIETVTRGQRTRQIAADRVRGLCQHPERCASDFAQHLRQCGDLRRVGMLDCGVAEEHGAPGSRQEARCDRLCRRRRCDLRERRGYRPARASCGGDDDLREGRSPQRRCHDRLVRNA